MNKIIRPLHCAVLFSLSVGLVTVGCNSRPMEERLLEPPFKRLTKIGSDELWLSLSEETDASKFYDLRIFSGLRPGATLCEAEAVLGHPGHAYEEKNGQNRVFPFSIESGAIEVYHHRVPSDNEDIVWEFHWCLRVRLDDADLNEFLPSKIIELLNAETLAPRYSLIVNSDFASVRYEIENNKIRQIIWNADEETIRRHRNEADQSAPKTSIFPESGTEDTPEHSSQ